METSQVMEYARSLYAAHGDKAEAEAAQNAQAAGTPEEADTWKAVRAAIRQLRGPNAS